MVIFPFIHGINGIKQHKVKSRINDIVCLDTGHLSNSRLDRMCFWEFWLILFCPLPTPYNTPKYLKVSALLQHVCLPKSTLLSAIDIGYDFKSQGPDVDDTTSIWFGRHLPRNRSCPRSNIVLGYYCRSH